MGLMIVNVAGFEKSKYCKPKKGHYGLPSAAEPQWQGIVLNLLYLYLYSLVSFVMFPLCPLWFCCLYWLFVCLLCS